MRFGNQDEITELQRQVAELQDAVRTLLGVLSSAAPLGPRYFQSLQGGDWLKALQPFAPESQLQIVNRLNSARPS